MPPSQPTTLRRLVTQPKPPINVIGTLRAGVTRGDFPEFKEEIDREGFYLHVSRWDLFNLATLNDSYGHVLDNEFHEDLFDTVPDPLNVLPNPIEISKLRDLHQLTYWNAQALGPSLKFAQFMLSLREDLKISQKFQEPGLEYQRVRIPGLPSRGTADIVNHVLSMNTFDPEEHLFVGIEKPTVKFDTEKVLAGRGTEDHEWVLRYLAYQCKRANTRYGYIMSERDLTVCRFSMLDDDLWKACIQPVPWDDHGESKLTTDLALLWLSLLAMSGEHNRAIMPDHLTTEIHRWKTIPKDEYGQKVRVHSYSELRKVVVD